MESLSIDHGILPFNAFEIAPKTRESFYYHTQNSFRFSFNIKIM